MEKIIDENQSREQARFSTVDQLQAKNQKCYEISILLLIGYIDCEKYLNMKQYLRQ